MKKVAIITIIILIIISSISFGNASNNTDAEMVNILYLNSYHEGYKWSDDIYEAFRSNLMISKYDARIDIEYMDTKRIVDLNYIEELKDIYEYKYANSIYDIIVCSDNAAFNFLIKYGDELFKDTPIVFCGVNNFNIETVHDNDMITGVVEGFDVSKTIQIAIDQNPNLKYVYYINDTTTTGIAIQHDFDNAITKFEGVLSFISLEGDNLQNICLDVANLPEDSIILHLIYFRDNEGNVYEYYESVECLSEYSNVPLYGVWDFHLGHGILGGVLTSGFDQGTQLAEITIQILDGKEPNQIPIKTEVENKTYFDFNQIEKHQIPSESVPKNSLVINNNNNEKIKVLLLHSYNKGLEWTDDIERGILDSLKIKENDIEYFYEYMDAKEYVNPVDQYYIRDSLLNKYENESFDLVIVSDDQAFKFVSDYRDILFENTPIVFCGVGYVDKDLVDNQFTGVTDNINIIETLDIALKLHPDTERIVVINDTTLTGRNNNINLGNAISNFSDEVNFEIWDDVNIDYIKTEAMKLSNKDLILLLTFNKDKSFNSFSHDDSIRIISDYATVPIYSVWDFYLGKGITGGKLISGYNQGSIAGEIALKILNGTPVEDIPIMQDDTSAYMFDYDLLIKYSIDLSSLPSESYVVNRPITIKEYILNNKTLLISIGISVLLILILLLIIYLLAKNNKIRGILIENENRFHVLFDQTPIGIINMSFSGEIIEANNQFINVSGYTLKELKETNIESIIYNDDKNDFIRLFSDVSVQSNIVNNYEIRFVKKDGSLAYSKVSLSVINDSKGIPIYLNTIIEDITKLKQIEMRNASLEMITRNQQKLESIGTLASGVAHEINNPINGIMNYAELILDSDDIISEAPIFSSEIIKESKRISKIVRSLLHFSRKEYDEFELVKVTDLIEDTLSLIRTVLKKDQIDFSVNLQKDLSLIKCNSQQIQQVIMNLLTNARDSLNAKYSKYNDNKKIFISATEVFKDNNAYIRICIEDKGVGLSDDIKDKIFDPFFTTKSRTEGTGLGLSISYNIIKEHNGRLWFETEVGLFTKFYIELPILNT